MYEQLLNLDPVKINFDKGGMDTLNIVLALVMYGVALGIKPSTFKQLIIHPKAIFLGLFGQWIVLPAMTFLMVVCLNRFITPMVAMGMILVASCPGGNISNFMTSFSKGNSELSVSLSAITTTCATVVTPLNFAIWGSLYVNYLNRQGADALQTLSIPMWDIFVTVFILLGLPLVAGMFTARYLPRLTELLTKPLQYLSIVVFIAMVGLAFYQNIDLFLKYIKYIFLIVLLHNALALGIGYTLGRIGKTAEKNVRALTIEIGIQNSGLGLILLFNPNIFPPELQNGGMLFITAWWGIWHVVSGLSIASWFRYKDLRKLKQATATDKRP